MSWREYFPFFFDREIVVGNGDCLRGQFERGSFDENLFKHFRFASSIDQHLLTHFNCICHELFVYFAHNVTRRCLFTRDAFFFYFVAENFPLTTREKIIFRFAFPHPNQISIGIINKFVSVTVRDTKINIFLLSILIVSPLHSAAFHLRLIRHESRE